MMITLLCVGVMAQAQPGGGGQPDVIPARTQESAQQGNLNRDQTGKPPGAGSQIVAEQIEPITADGATAVDVAEEGIPFGSFLLFPDINTGGTYNTNVFATRTDEKPDWIWSLTPSLQVRSDWDKHRVNMNMGVTADRYQTHTGQNTDDFWLNAEGLFDISDTSNVYGGAGFSRNHEDRGSPDATATREPTQYDSTNAFAGAFHDFGPATVRFGVSSTKLNYEDGESAIGIKMENDDRDRTVTSVGGRASYKLDPSLDIFVQAMTDNRRYDSTPDSPGGFYRDSDGYHVDVGAAFNINQRIVGEGYVGTRKQDYDDSRLSDVSVPDFGASVRWHTSPWTIYRFSLDRTVEESVLWGTSSYVDTSATASVEYDLGRNTLATASVTMGEDDFRGTSRLDKYAQGAVGIKHYVSDAVYLGADLNILRRSSNDLESNYNQALMALTVGSDFGARRRPRYFAYEDKINVDFEGNNSRYFDGFYVGGEVGHGNVASETSGPRDGGLPPGNADAGEFGNDGGMYGFFAGIGRTFKQWYLGVEVEGNRSDIDFSHVHQAANITEPLTFSVEQEDSWVGSLRGGYVLKSGPLLYGRLGYAHTDFSNVLQDESVSMTPDQTLDGIVVGVGSDIPVDDNMFIRMDYSHTTYDDYNVVINKPAPDTYNEQYENRGGVFKLGVGYRFGENKAQKQTAVDPAYLRGMYVGGQVGYGAVLTDLEALHAHPSNPPLYPLNDTLSADFGREGATAGVFGGYAYTFNRWYTALELEMDASSDAEWQHERSPGGGTGGRDFSVSKKGGYGAAAKLGYVLPNGTLLYGRAGPVSTRFSTYYARGAGSPAIDYDETQSGLRYGVGAEIPISKMSFWRLDYTVTDYDDFTFTTLQGVPANRDVVTMSNSENLFRLGVGFRF